MKTAIPFRRRYPVFLMALTASSAGAQTDNFNDGNDAGWTKLEPLKLFGAASSVAVSGGGYTLTCNPSPDEPQLGPARCGSLRQDKSYGTFCVTVDIVNWDPAEDTSMGLLARLQPNPGIGATDGYAFTFQGKDQDVQLSRITGEKPASLSGSPAVTLTPGNGYRMVFFGIGGYLEGRIYDLNDLANPLVTAFGTDDTYRQGNCGLVVFADENTRASATFDNYSAGDGTPPPLTVIVAEGNTTASWNSAAGLCHTLEASNDLLNWSPLYFYTAAAGRTGFSEPFDSFVPSRFFRLRLGP